MPSPQEIQRQVYLDFSRGEYQLALEGSEVFLEAYPDHPLGEEVHFIRGECFIEQDKHFDSLKEFSIILKRYPHGNRVPAALLRMAVSYEKTGQSGLALANFEKAAQLNPQDAAAQFNYGKEALAAGYTNDAVAALEKGLEIEPDNALFRTNLERLRGQQEE